MDRDEWLAYGHAQGWVGPVVCATHDVVPSTEAEDLAWEDGEEPDCVWVLRAYTSPAEKEAVEANHPPSTWRLPRVDPAT